MRVLVVRTPVSSLSFQVQHTRYLVPGTVHASTQQTIQIRGTGVCLARKTLLVSRDYLIARRCYTQSNAFPMRLRRRRSAVSQWNVDPLQCTTLRGVRSARSGLGQRSFRSSALHRKSFHASVSVMLEKRGGRCRTDGPMRVLSCQMRHTIAAIRPRCVALCV